MANALISAVNNGVINATDTRFIQCTKLIMHELRQHNGALSTSLLHIIMKHSYLFTDETYVEALYTLKHSQIKIVGKGRWRMVRLREEIGSHLGEGI
jgi:GH15 family glucan-1,4-alpha-glucosidase